MPVAGMTIEPRGEAPTEPAAGETPDTPPTPKGSGGSNRRPLLLGAGGLALGSAALWGVSLGTRATFDDPATPYEDLAALQGRANATGYAAQATTIAALGLGAFAVVRF
jgi:hypothetical protein